jgi:two-component system alkaline phosphatase synthesis response regulator PhoP
MKETGKKRILIIEDEEHIAEGLKFNLSRQGHDVMIAPDGMSGLRQWKEWQPHLIVLDIMLPGINGFSVLQSIRLVDERLPVLILSARSAPDDRIRGLSHGSDDYMTKPFSLEEFLLRIERLLARVTWGREEEKAGPSRQTYAFGGNEIDFNAFTARCRQGTIHLTEQEVKILKLFIANRGTPLSRKHLLEIGWGYTGVTTTRTVDNFIVRFRRYFENNPQKPVYFKSLRSVGYVFDHD